jgi:hypothetical protein
VVVKDAITDKTTAYTITVRPDGTIERSEEQPLPAEAPAPAKAPADEEETADEEEEKDFQDTLDIFTARIEKVKSSINPESAMVYTPNMLCLNDMDEIMSRATRQGLAFMKSKNAYSFTRGEKLSAEEAFGKLDKSLSDWENVLYMSSCNNPSAFAPSVPFLPFNPFVSVPTSPAIPGLN